MSLSRSSLRGLGNTRALLDSWLERPDLAAQIQALPPQVFASLVRRIGVEDAGTWIALATTEQLVQAFDEDWFTSERAGEREVFDVGRFVVWLEVLLEAGEDVVASKLAELDEDFVAHALSSVVLVLDEEELRQRLDEGEEDEVSLVDKSLESALAEQLDGYLLIARRHEGWDAVLSLILALDRDHRALCERLLDRLVAVSRSSLEDLEELSTVLTEGESLAEDVEAAREQRRSEQGYVEPRAARGFLELARSPLPEGAKTIDARDPLTQAYFRELVRSRRSTIRAYSSSDGSRTTRGTPLLEELSAQAETMGLSLSVGGPAQSTLRSFTEALRELGSVEPESFDARLDELAYLVNVLLAGHERSGERWSPREAMEAALATVGFGAVLEFRDAAKGRRRKVPSRADWLELLRRHPMDLLFRRASSSLRARLRKSSARDEEDGLLLSAEALEALVLSRAGISLRA